MSEVSLPTGPPQPTSERLELWAQITQRTTRGMLLFNSGEALAHLEGNHWAVRASEGGFYRVDMDAESCTCPDYQYRASALNITCKHVYAVAICRATLSRTSQARLGRCAGCHRRVPRSGLVEVGPELVAFGNSVQEGERYCKPCAIRHGVV